MSAIDHYSGSNEDEDDRGCTEESFIHQQTNKNPREHGFERTLSDWKWGKYGKVRMLEAPKPVTS